MPGRLGLNGYLAQDVFWPFYALFFAQAACWLVCSAAILTGPSSRVTAVTGQTGDSAANQMDGPRGFWAVPTLTYVNTNVRAEAEERIWRD